MLTSFIRKLEAFGPLPDRDKRALEQAKRRTRHVCAGRDLVREGDHPTQCRLILQGFSYRHRTLKDGRRQIMSFEIPGDLCGLHGVLLGQADHAVTTLTPCRVATLPREVLTDWIENRPAVARALWCGALVDAAVSRAWMFNIGRRTARGRVAHLLCEMVLRLQAVGLAEDGGCTLPIPPVEIADALGLSVVHVNRTLRGLYGEGLATPGDGQVTIDDLPGLQAASGFDPAYLHLSGHTGGNVGGRVRSRRTGRAVAAIEPKATGLESGDGDRMRSILESTAGHAIVAAGPDGRITGWWGGASRLLGWEEADVLGRDLAMLYTPEGRAAGVPEAGMREAREQGWVEEGCWHIRRDGSRFWSNGELRLIRGEAGAAVGYLKVMRDSTARRTADEALRGAARGRERVVAMLGHSQTLVCDWDGRVEVWSQGMERLFGYAPADAVGTSARELLCSQFPEPWPAMVAALRRDGRWQGEVRHRHKDGSARFAQESWAVQPGLDGGMSSLVAAVEDQTAVKRAEEALREANATLEARVEARTAELMAAEATLRQSRKMEAIGQLTGGIAHDFNNVLQGITANLDLLRLRAEQGRPGSVVRHLAAAHKSVGHAAALTNRLLAFARQLPLDPALATMDALALGMEELIRRTVGPSVQVELRLGGSLWPVLCDAGQLESALLNLAINARDAMAQLSPGGSTREAGARPDGGWLTISTGEAQLSAADLVGEDGTAPGAFATVAVTDTGAGMAPEVMARAFEPFFTTKPLGQGTGLGLSQIYGFVRQSGGVVRLESAPGRGTTVRIFLPRHEPATADDAGEGNGTSELVLLVKDEDVGSGVDV